MSVVAPIVDVTLRGLLSRRRMILLILLVGLPVLIGLLVRVSGGRPDADRVLDTLVVRTVMPLVALIIGTAAIGSEIEDGTAVYLMVKPIARWKIALAKILVAVGLTAVLVIPSIVDHRSPARERERPVDGDRRLRGRLSGRRQRLRGGLPDLQRVHVTGAPARTGLRPHLGGCPVRDPRQARSSCRSARPPWGWPPPSVSTCRAAPRWRLRVSVLVLVVVLVGAFLLASWKLARFEIRGGD